MCLPNRAITSREYKLILNADRFENVERGSETFWNLIEFLIRKQDGKIVQKQDDVIKRLTWYVDTSEFALRRNGFALRLRKEDYEKKKYKVTLKYRSPDRYISAAQDVSSSEKDKIKFEEDIIPPFNSIFAHSGSFRKKECPGLENMGDAMKLFRGLGSLGLSGDTPIKIVSSFKALEVTRWTGKVKFEEEIEVKTCLSFWYLLSEADEWPLVVEFSFDYDVPESESEDEQKLEQVPIKSVEGANDLFRSLQKQHGWINLTCTTKTAYAYSGF